MVGRCGITIILGSPAVGKTTLARRLAAELGMPYLCKDDVKESLFDVLGTGDREWSRRLSRASFAALIRVAEAQMAAGLSCVLDGNFTEEQTGGLKAALARRSGRAIQIRCLADPDELRRRFAGRQRHPGHLDAVLAQERVSEPPFLELPGPRLDYFTGRRGKGQRGDGPPGSDNARAETDLIRLLREWQWQLKTTGQPR
jgi:predicted kinase